MSKIIMEIDAEEPLDEQQAKGLIAMVAANAAYAVEKNYDGTNNSTGSVDNVFYKMEWILQNLKKIK